MKALVQLTERVRQGPGTIRRFRPSSTTCCKNYVGRPNPLYFAERLTKKCGGAKIYLKREDLNHTGAHKINNTLGQALLTLRMGKKRVIAETGAGQHGVATATACARFGLECVVYMGEEDIRRQKLNVFNMKMLGAEVRPVTSGSRTLRDAINEAMRDWMASRRNDALHHRLGRRAASVPADRPRFPIGHRPRDDRAIAGRNSAGCRTSSSPASAAAATRRACSIRSSTHAGVELVGVEAGGRGAKPGEHAAPLSLRRARRAARQLQLRHARRRRPDVRRPSRLGRSRLSRRRPRAQLLERRAAASVTPYCDDDDALAAFDALARTEGILPALESSHAIAKANGDRRASARKDEIVVVCLSGRGDKDAFEVARLKGMQLE